LPRVGPSRVAENFANLDPIIARLVSNSSLVASESPRCDRHGHFYTSRPDCIVPLHPPGQRPCGTT